MKVIIPMAGLGQRFVDAGYTEPKPMNNAPINPMFRPGIDPMGLPNRRPSNIPGNMTMGPKQLNRMLMANMMGLLA